MVFIDLGAPLAVPEVSCWSGFEGLPPALGVSVFVLESVCDVGWKRGVVTPVAHLLFGSIVPHRAHCLVFMRRTVGLGPGRWVKQFNSIPYLQP